MAVYHLKVSVGSRAGGQSAGAKFDNIEREGLLCRGHRGTRTQGRPALLPAGDGRARAGQRTGCTAKSSSPAGLILTDLKGTETPPKIISLPNFDCSDK